MRKGCCQPKSRRRNRPCPWDHHPSRMVISGSPIRRCAPADVRRLEEKLARGIRYQMDRRDIGELGDAHDTAIEVWVHPDDHGAASVMLHEVLTEQ